jgi:hypothetical protein
VTFPDISAVWPEENIPGNRSGEGSGLESRTLGVLSQKTRAAFDLEKFSIVRNGLFIISTPFSIERRGTLIFEKPNSPRRHLYRYQLKHNPHKSPLVSS